MAPFPDANLVILHNPEVAYKRFLLQQRQEPGRQSQECGDALYSRPENNYAVIILRRIGPNIREVQIKRNKSTSFLPADLSQVGIYAPAQALLHNRDRIVLMIYKQIFDFERQVFVELTTH